MSSKALQLYWSRIKAATESNWKYLLAFSVGSIASAVFSFLFTKSLTGWNISELLINIFLKSGARKYRDIVDITDYKAFSVHPSPIRPSTENIAMNAFMR